ANSNHLEGGTWEVPGTIGSTTPNTGAFTTLGGTTITASTQFSGPGTGLTGTAAGLSIGGNAATATLAANSNHLEGGTWEVPGTIGSTTPNTGAFTTLGGTTITASTQFSGPGTGLTGTAAGLSIGGNAATATLAANSNHLEGGTWEVPGTIGSTTPDPGALTTLGGTPITASTQFSGPGTGLTGTAAGLSIGGHAATATLAANSNHLEGGTWEVPGTIG